MSDQDSIQIGQLHGAKLTYETDGGVREVIATFECDDYPNCETCGDLDETVDPGSSMRVDSGDDAIRVRSGTVKW